MSIPAVANDEFWTGAEGKTRTEQLLRAVRTIISSGDRALLIPTRDGIHVIRQKQSKLTEVTKAV